jgi:NAD(P)-dependent dehydrogenase (short-subunit alcohol dehydrogenase family)
MRFDAKVALVTGAGGGLGRAHALLLAARGASVVVNDIGGFGREAQKGASAQAVVEAIEAAGGTAQADTNSVATSQGGEAMVAAALERFGRLDIVVHNAGVGRPVRNFESISDAQLDLMLKTHLYGAFHVLRPAWVQMKSQGYGRIVNTASSTALGVRDSWDYPAAKGGLISLTRCLALAGERHNIKVNAIMPMAFTPMSQQVPDEAIKEWMARVFPSEQVAPTVAFLCHEDVPVSGETFSVGGGRTARVTYVVARGHSEEEPTIESLRANFDRVMSLDDHVVARSGADDAALFQHGYAEIDPTRER